MGIFHRLLSRRPQRRVSFMIRYQQLKMPLHYTIEDVRQKIGASLHIDPKSIRDLTLLRESLDARKKPELYYVLSAAFCCDKEKALLQKYKKGGLILPYEEKKLVLPRLSGKQKGQRPVVVGSGPAGLFCCYYLAKAGLSPILVERGRDVTKRSKDVERFFETGILDPESNVQFGEGGAGTFSDGKLTTSNKDPLGYQKEILKIFVSMGADERILYEQKPHIGTDKLVEVVKNLRKEIINLGGEVLFETKATDLIIEEGDEKRIKGVILNGERRLLSDQVVLAIGHSARDTFSMLYEKGFLLEAKPFAVGLRIQHSQEMIDASQYGSIHAGKLAAASYKLTAQAQNGRSVFTFCMCPGGYVVNASSETGGLCVNGMSYSDRSGENANSAVIVSVTPDDFKDRDPLAGIRFQRELEKKAYELNKGAIPIQRYEDYEMNRPTGKAGSIRVCVKGQYAFSNLRGLLPKEAEEAFLDAMGQFDKKLKGFADPDALLSGVEARTSSPVRILRDESGQALTVKGVYPCGEGAGYAGGITSAAVDGLKTAIALLKNLGGI